LTMRSFAEEKRLGTLETLMSAPVSSLGLVLGKWSASLLFFSVIVLLSFCYPLLLIYAYPNQADSLGLRLIEQWLGGAVFILGFGCSFTAVGIWASVISHNQMVAGMLTFTLLTLYLSAMTFSFGETIENHTLDDLGDLINVCLGSINQGLNKAQNFAVGIIDLATLLHQLAITSFFLWITIIQVERLKH